MDTNTAISNIAYLIEENDAAFYVFQPPDLEQKFFLETAAISAAATILLTAFLKGVMSKLEDRAEGLGEKVADWMVDQLGQLFRSSPNKLLQEDLQSIADKTKGALAISDDIRTSSAFEETEQLMNNLLEQRGFLDTRANQITNTVCKSANSLVREGWKYVS